MKLKALLTLAIASLCSWQGAWAERVAPVFPSDHAKMLESGQSYYLYNPGSDRFVYRSGNPLADPTSRAQITITNVEGDVYTMQFLSSGYWIYSNGNSTVYASTNPTTSYRRFRIDSTDGGYTIQRDYNYNETYYVGNATGNTNVVSNMTSGNIIWQLYDADGVNAIIRYRAKKALYDALVSADDYSLSFAVEEYEALYANDEATNEELNNAATTINNALLWNDRLANGESEYPIFTELTGSATWNSNSSGYTNTTIKNGEGGLKATVEVDQDATFVYDYHLASSWTGYSFNVYLDGELYQNISNYEGYDDQSSTTYYQKFFVELTAGRHTVEWKAKSTSGSTATTFYLKGLAAYKTPTITVNLTQAGSLGTEVLYNVDHIKEVRKLVVKGNMNSDDFERINMMTNLFDLDFSETTVTSLPKINPGVFFHKIKLPTGLVTIQESALASTPIEEIVFPSTLTSIGSGAFRYTRIKEAIMPETMTSVGTYAFASNQSLNSVVWPTQVKSIPAHCFDGDRSLHIDLPEGLTTIGDYAFRFNYDCNFQLPSTIQSIGHYAFTCANKIESIYIPANTSIGAGAFYSCYGLKKVIMGESCGYKGDVAYYQLNSTSSYTSMPGTNTFNGCTKLEEVEFPTTMNAINRTRMFAGCTNLKKVTYKSPTLIGGDNYNKVFDGLSTDIVVYVPSYLVNAYKLDPYWYNYNIMGFSTADVTSWVINNTLTFFSQDRFEGTPKINLQSGGGKWTINGDLAQNIGDFITWYRCQESSGGVGSASEIISNCNNVNITGSYRHGYYVYNKYKSGSYTYDGRWHFICLPFDIKVSDITTTDNARFAIRYYDGANRAVNGTGGNWKDYATDAVIPAGTGFILQASKACYIYFYALDNASKQNVVSNEIFTKALEAYESEQNSNKGWNLVGNPWLCYYNIHKMNFTGPITVYDGYNRKYSAYSMIDDDYAIRPNQAFFVQCPDEVTEISFPVDGRQMTSVIESQNGARTEQASERRLIDVELCSASNTEAAGEDGEQSDKTRFVLNPKASMNYEMQRDASKFLETGTDVPQIYTIEQGEALAINERPLGDGTVTLGIIIPQNGTYTITAPRNQFQNIVLVDNETGIETLLADGVTYTFTADKGTHNSRFMLRVGGTVVTSVSEKLIVNSEEFAAAPCYNLNGQRIAAPQKGLYIVNGKKVLK